MPRFGTKVTPPGPFAAAAAAAAVRVRTRERSREEVGSSQRRPSMASTSVHCCLNASPPNPVPPPSTFTKRTLSPWPATAAARKEASWSRRCLTTAACVILGSSVGLAEVGVAGERFAYAAADQTPVAAVAPRLARWSEVRECPPWRANSLENIVPENLPRPSARRRWETVRMSRSAPAVAGRPVGVASEGCYSL